MTRKLNNAKPNIGQSQQNIPQTLLSSARLTIYGTTFSLPSSDVWTDVSLTVPVSWDVTNDAITLQLGLTGILTSPYEVLQAVTLLDSPFPAANRARQHY